MGTISTRAKSKLDLTAGMVGLDPNDKKGFKIRRGSPGLRSDLSRSVDDVFVAAELGEPHGAPGVEAVGADTDFGSEAKFETIVEAGASIPKYSRAIDGGLEAGGGVGIGRNDGFAVTAAVAINLSDGVLEGIDDAHGHGQGEKFGSKIVGDRSPMRDVRFF